MVDEADLPASAHFPTLAVFAGLLAMGIFAVDTLSPLGMAVAVLYVVVIMMSVNFLPRRGVLLVSLGCAALTVLSYLLSHGTDFSGTPPVRFFVSLSAIGITAFLALKNLSAAEALREQAQLLDLTHDAIFVRDMDNTITYWNRGAEALYGWHGEQAVGKMGHQLLQTVFPVPLEQITAELLRADRWEGELIQARCEGPPVVVSSRWSLKRNERGQPVGILETNTDITERRAAQEKLRQAERELRATIDTIPTLVWSAFPDGMPDFINARWTELGFCEEDLRSSWPKLVHPDDLAEVMRRWSAALATGEPYEVEARLRRTDGKYRWFLTRAVALRDEAGNIVKWYATGTDIEARKRAEGALRRSEALLAETQTLSRTGSIGLSAATGEMFWSAEAARIFGYDPAVRPTISLVLERVHPDDRQLARRSIDRPSEGDADPELEYRLLMPDGGIKFVRSLSHLVTDPLGDREVLCALIDVTAAREAEAALQEAQAELAHVTRVTTLGEFTASIAHEVNQPLAAIVTNGEVCIRLLDQGAPALGDVRDAIGDIISNGRRASEIIRRLRALSKKTEASMTPLDVNDVIHEIVPLVRREVLGHRASLRLGLSPDLPQVLADPVQLQQVVLNLLINGLEAMAPASERPRELAIQTLQDDDGKVLVSVRDTGVGIDPATATQLFNAFFTTKTSGMGMGLSICRSIIEHHGGRIWAQPNEGPGATFQFTLPVRQEDVP